MAPIFATQEFLTKQVQALEEQRTRNEAMIESLKNQVTELSAKVGPGHTNCDYWKAENGRIQGQLIDLVDAFYEDEQNNFEIINDICTIIDYNPTKEIEFTATMSFTGRIEVPRAEADSFDLTEILEDAYVDINNGNVVIDNYELYDANEC